MLDDFLTRAALAGIGVAMATGPLGCFVVWRRMAYFGDATAHAAVLGVALALSFEISMTVGVLVAALAMALTVSALAGRGFAVDTLLGVAAHGALAVGLVAVALNRQPGLDLEGFLFGEILAVNRTDLVVIWGGAALVVACLAWRWRALLTATLNPDLAFASGLNPDRERMVLTVALAMVVAVSLKVVGALLITAMLIIPAASARPLARTPEAMAVIAVAMGVASVLGGLQTSLILDTPTGPTIVAIAAGLFTMSAMIGALRR